MLRLEPGQPDLHVFEGLVDCADGEEQLLSPPEAAEADDSHAFWTGRLSMLLACFLAGRTDKAYLRETYREFLRSPACAPEVRAMLRDVSG